MRTTLKTGTTIEETAEIPAGSVGWRRGDHDQPPPPPKLGLIGTMRAEPGVVAWVVAEWVVVFVFCVMAVALAFCVAIGCYALLEVAS